MGGGGQYTESLRYSLEKLALEGPGMGMPSMALKAAETVVEEVVSY